MHALRSIFALLPALLASLGFAANVRAEEAAIDREDQFKAAYLFNFLKFVDWPASVTSDVLTVCFVGGKGVQETLAADIDSKRAGNRRLAVKQLHAITAADGCNVLYIDATTRDVLAANVGELPILTVSDATAFARHGGMIELFTDSNRLRFAINVYNTQKAGLRISSNLLQLAAQVDREKP